MKLAVKIKDLRKSYSPYIVLDNINLEIYEGEIFGLLGPNGAGKSTLIQILSTSKVFDSGQIEIFNMDIKRLSEEVKKMIGIVPQEVAIYEELTVKENLLFFGGIYGLKGRVLLRKTNEYIERFGLQNYMKRLAKELSSGMKRRLNIACSLLHEPPLVLMDEPTAGLDPASRQFIYEFVKQFQREGKTVLYATHYIDEAEELCQRVAIMDNGVILELDTPEGLITRHKGLELLEFEIANPITNRIKQMLNDKFAGYKLIIADKRIRLALENGRNRLPYIMRELQNHLRIKSVNIKLPGLRSVFLQLTGRLLDNNESN